MNTTTKQAYWLDLGEPGYSESTVASEPMSLNDCVRKWLAARAAYRRDPENNPSYGKIRIDRTDHEVADEDLMFGDSFEKPNPLYNAEQNYVGIRAEVARRAKDYSNGCD